MSAADLPAALLGDAHLRENDPETEAFIAFLDSLPGDIGTLVILGDLFAAWVGRQELLRPHHRAVIEALRRLRGRSCRLLYVEGNHDFFLRPLLSPDPFDACAEVSLDLTLAGWRAHLAHGDLVNSRDRQYRAWRAVSKNGAAFSAFNLIPRVWRQKLIDSLERGMASTNMEFRGGFPREEALRYARPIVAAGAQVLVFGHFHEELTIPVEGQGRRGTVYVVPAWRAGHRYLRMAPDAEPVFVSA